MSLTVTVADGGKKITYEDLLAAQEAMAKDIKIPTLIYHPSVIDACIEEGVMREDEYGRVWTVMTQFPSLHHIEVFASDELNEMDGFFIPDTNKMIQLPEQKGVKYENK